MLFSVWSLTQQRSVTCLSSTIRRFSCMQPIASENTMHEHSRHTFCHLRHSRQNNGSQYARSCLVSSSAQLGCRYTTTSRYNSHQTGQHRNYSSGSSQLPRVYLFTKQDCSLCDQAKEVLQPIRHKFTLEEVDITLPENERWYELYKYDIPVFHMYEEFVCKHKADIPAFEAMLNKYKHGFVKGQ